MALFFYAVGFLPEQSKAEPGCKFAWEERERGRESSFAFERSGSICAKGAAPEKDGEEGKQSRGGARGARPASRLDHPPSEKGGGYPAFSGHGILPRVKMPGGRSAGKELRSDFFAKLAAPEKGKSCSDFPFWQRNSTLIQ